MSEQPDIVARRKGILSRCSHLISDTFKREGWPLDTCYLQSGLAIDVLDHFGIKGEPMQCEVDIYNPPATEWLNRNPEFIGRKDLNVPANGAYVAHLGHREGGHLVVAAKDRSWLMDPSIGQASRSEHGVNLHPIWTAPPKRGMVGRTNFGMIQGDCMILYRWLPDDRRYRRHKDWKDRRRMEPVVKAIIECIERIPMPTSYA